MFLTVIYGCTNSVIACVIQKAEPQAVTQAITLMGSTISKPVVRDKTNKVGKVGESLTF